MVLGSESVFMTKTKDTFNATYKKVTLEGKEVKCMVGSSMSQRHIIHTHLRPTPITRAN
jgi:hypothetical protein